MSKVPNGVEILPKLSTGWVERTSVTDGRRTDGQTDRRQHNSEREREFAKNEPQTDPVHVDDWDDASRV